MDMPFPRIWLLISNIQNLFGGKFYFQPDRKELNFNIFLYEWIDDPQSVFNQLIVI
jgi:hypothetical protein